MTDVVSRERAVAIARAWIGTPYHHQASCKGAGVDCLGLVRGIYRELLGRDVAAHANYSRDWGEANGVEAMLEGAREYLEEVARDELRPGNVVVFRLRRGVVAKHAAIVASATTMIHAMEGCAVSEVQFSPWWRRHIAGVFRFPLIDCGE